MHTDLKTPVNEETSSPEIVITQILSTVQLSEFIPKMGKVQQDQKKTGLQAPTKTTMPISKAVEMELKAAMTAKKLTFSSGGAEGRHTMAATVKGNHNVQKGM